MASAARLIALCGDMIVGGVHVLPMLRLDLGNTGAAGIVELLGVGVQYIVLRIALRILAA